MVTKPKPRPDDPEQSRRFIDAAKKVGVDETGREFAKALEKITPEKRPVNAPT